MSGTFSSPARTPRLFEGQPSAGSLSAPVSAFEARLPSYQGSQPIPMRSPPRPYRAASPFDALDSGREGPGRCPEPPPVPSPCSSQRCSLLS